jgi:hypothetical protein
MMHLANSVGRALPYPPIPARWPSQKGRGRVPRLVVSPHQFERYAEGATLALALANVSRGAGAFHFSWTVLPWGPGSAFPYLRSICAT